MPEKESRRQEESAHIPDKKRESLLAREAARRMAELDQEAEGAQRGEAKKEAMITTEMQKLNDIFERGDRAALSEIEGREQTIEEKIVAFDFAITNRTPIQLTLEGGDVGVMDPDDMWEDSFVVRPKEMIGMVQKRT